MSNATCQEGYLKHPQNPITKYKRSSGRKFLITLIAVSLRLLGLIGMEGALDSLINVALRLLIS